MAEKEVKKTSVKKAPEAKKQTVSVSTYDKTGKVVGSMDLPEQIFAAKENKELIAQAVRVYRANQRQGTLSTKTRGEVAGSTRKIYRQKGTGRARHGGIRAPIFVHGGVAHGPKPTDHSLTMPVKMRRLALFAALTGKLRQEEMKIVTDLATIEPKTKVMLSALKALTPDTQAKKVLVVTGGKEESVLRAARNIRNVTVTACDRLNTYEVLVNKHIVLMADAVEVMKTAFLKGKKHE